MQTQAYNSRKRLNKEEQTPEQNQQDETFEEGLHTTNPLDMNNAKLIMEMRKAKLESMVGPIEELLASGGA